MEVVAKKDIDTLTKQLLLNKYDILETIKREHIQIDSSLLCENFAPQFEEKLHRTAELYIVSLDHEYDTISLEDMENIVHRFDKLDKQLQEPKSCVNNIGSTITGKEVHGSKRFGSMTDINKTLLHSSSLFNLNSTKIFVEPHAPTFRVCVNSNNTFMCNNSNNETTPFIAKLSSNRLSEHNMLEEEVGHRINSTETDTKSYLTLLLDINQNYKTSFGRLNTFFKEIQKIQSNKSAESMHAVSLKELDGNLINSMKMLSQALVQVRFIAENMNLYNSSGVEEINSVLSHNLTDILEQFYRSK